MEGDKNKDIQEKLKKEISEMERSFDETRIHYHSDQQESFSELAYAQGSSIYVGP